MISYFEDGNILDTSFQKKIRQIQDMFWKPRVYLLSNCLIYNCVYANQTNSDDCVVFG